jgi:predicted Fe-Mo cluster-binding NifX family protein
MATILQKGLLMKVAIPYWQGQISPVFDTAREILFIHVENGHVVRRRKTLIVEKNPLTKVNYIVQLGTEVLICGAISWSLQRALFSTGVHVIANIHGQVEDTIKALLSNQLIEKSTK